MIAVDTNIVVRLLVADDPKQTALAQACIARGVFISHGVLMETEWVLRSVYRLSTKQIADLLRDLVELRDIDVEHRDDLRWAVARYRRGADWADLLHLIAARGQERFATFDADLSRQAGKDSPTSIEILR